MPAHDTGHYPIERYLNVRGVMSPAYFSNGKRLAFLSDITGIAQVWAADVPAPGEPPLWPDQLTFDSERVVWLRTSPAPGDSRVFYARDQSGSEKLQLFVLDPDTGQETALTAGYENAMHLPGDVSHDGTHVLYAANRRDPGLFDLYEQPVDGPARLVWQNDQPGFVSAVYAPDGSQAVVRLMISSFEHVLIAIDLVTGAARPLTPDSTAGAGPVRYETPYYSADGRALYMLTDRESDFMLLERLDLSTLAWETLVAPGWDIEGILPSPDGRWLAYAVNVDGVSDLYIYDTQRGISQRVPALDGPGIVTMLGELQVCFSPDARRLAFMHLLATHSGDIWVWDRELEQAQPVTRSAHGGLPLDAFVAPELIHYPTFDTNADGTPRTIPAWLYRPPVDAGHAAPVVVLVHGGPESQSRPLFFPYIQYIVNHGYAVLVPNVRGSTGYGKAYSHLDDVEKRMDSVADLAHAAYWLKQQPGIDGDRIVVYGGSYGGFMVLSALTTYPDLWVAGVDTVGISSFVTFLENTSDYRRAHREAEYGSLAHDRAFLESISPINHVDRIKAPLMVIHGANDPRVPLSEAEQMVAALKARGVPVEFMVFDDEGHGILKLKNRLVSYPAIVAFLDRYVGRQGIPRRDK